MKLKEFFSLQKLFLFCLLLVATLTSGCIKYSYNIEIDNRDNVSISEINAINLSFIKSIDPTAEAKFNSEIQSKKNLLKEAGFTVENYKDDVYTGYKTFKKYSKSKFTKSDLPKGFSSNLDSPIEIKKTFFKKNYKISLTYDMNNINKDPKSSKDSDVDKIVSRTKKTDPESGKITERIVYESGAVSTTSYYPGEMNDLGNIFGYALTSASGVTPVIDLTLKIPVAASSHNAKEAKGNEYTWDLVSDAPVNIELSYEIINWFNIILSIFILITLILLGIAIKNRGSAHRDREDFQ